MAKSFEKNRELNYLAIIKAVVFLLAVVLAFVLLLVIVQRASDTSTVSNPSESTVSNETSADTSIAVVETSQPPMVNNYIPIEVETSSLHEGTTILVNSSNEFVFPNNEFAPVMAETKNSDYYVRDRSVHLREEVTAMINEMMTEYRTLKNKKNIMIFNGYLDKATQKTYYDRAVSNYGEERASMMQALPGFADAHTGYSVDLRMYNNEEITDFKGENESSWIVENAYKYGFILRFPEGKEVTTGFNGSTGKYRYVGIPHSVMIRNNDFTLEEYITKVKAYTYDTDHWYCEYNGSSYEVYFAPAANGDTTVIYVPADKNYIISGNNVDGFIVTVKY